MNKAKIYTLLVTLASLFAACQSDDFVAQKSDELQSQQANSKKIQFSVEQEEVSTRSYSSYTTSNRPSDMGVWGYAELANVSDANFSASDAATDHKIFTNQQVTYNEGDWEYTPAKYWEDYATLSPFDFFAYMPKSDDAAIVKSGKTYTLSLPMTLDAPLTTKETALICHTPYHTTNVASTIPFLMDQTLTGFNIQFALGTKMDNVRDITITSVKIKGEKSMFAGSGTISRTYTCTLNDNGDIAKWDSTKTEWVCVSPAEDIDVEVPGKPASLLLTTEFQQWGSNFFAIPMGYKNTGTETKPVNVPVFQPTIEVTYTVTLNDDGITTRSVTSTIVLNNKNFSNYTKAKYAGMMGVVYPVKIKIVPSYLYVLADDDQTAGYITIE